MMALQEDAQPRGIKAQRVAHAVVVNVRRTLPWPVIGVGIVVIFSRSDRFELYLALVAEARKAALRVPDISDAARHAGSEIASSVADHRDDAAGHVFTAVIAGTFDDGDRARIAHGETLAGNPLEIGLAGDGAVKHGIADDDVLGRLAPRLQRLAYDQPSARQSLAGVVIGIAIKLQ